MQILPKTLQALQDSVLQLEARASIAEAGKAVAQQQLAQLRQQVAAEGNAHQAQVSMLTAQLTHQDAVLASAAQYLGPLESRANPVSPVLSPRLSNAPKVSRAQICIAHDLNGPALVMPTTLSNAPQDSRIYACALLTHSENIFMVQSRTSCTSCNRRNGVQGSGAGQVSS